MNVVTPLKTTLGPAEAFLSKSHRLLIDGQWVEARSGETFETLNPATEDVITTVALGAAADIDAAVAAARKAFDDGPWPRMTPAERQRILQKLGDLIEENGEELAWIESLDNGKPVKVARSAEIPLTADLFHYMAAHARTREGHVVPTSDFAIPGADFHAYTVEEPVGVVGLITPWNCPLLIAAGWQMAGALAAGNTIVLKPSEVTPLSIVRFGELALEAGLPPGVVNIVQGYGGEAGARLVEHPQVDKIGFTGSTRTGRGLLIGKVLRFNEALGIPANLGEMGVRDEDVPHLARLRARRSLRRHQPETGDCRRDASPLSAGHQRCRHPAT